MDAQKAEEKALPQKEKQPFQPDFVKEPTTHLLKKKVEEWVNAALLGGALKA